MNGKSQDNVSKNEIICFVIIIFTGCIIYYQMAVQWLTNPDGVWNSLYSRASYSEEMANGRLGQVFVGMLKMDYVSPVLVTVFCIIVLSVTSILIGRIFEQKGILINLMIGGILLFVPCTSSSLTYYYCSDSFTLAFLLVIFGIYVVRKYKETWCYFGGVCLFLFSIYLYQAYICVVFIVALLLLILDLVECKKCLKQAIISWLQLMSLSGVAILLYVVTYKMISTLFQLNVRADRGLDFSETISVERLLLLVKEAYYNFFDYFFGNGLINNDFGYRNIINLSICFIGIISVCYFIIKKGIWKKSSTLIVLMLCGGLIPLMAEAIVVMAYKVDNYGPTGIIMIPTMAFIYIFVLVIGYDAANIIKSKWTKVMIIVPITIFIWNSILFTNLCISSMQLEFNKTKTVANILLNEIINEFGYQEGTNKLLVAGHLEAGKFGNQNVSMQDAIKGTSASYGFMWNTYSGNENCWIEFYKQYMGVLFSACDYKEYEDFLLSDIYQTMPLFPEKGSIVKIDDIIIVKMSEVLLK